MENFQTTFSATSAAVQGSGWGWLGYNQGSKSLEIVLHGQDSGERDIPDYIECDQKKLTAKLTRIPKLDEVPYPVQMEPNLVVEFYSRN